MLNYRQHLQQEDFLELEVNRRSMQMEKKVINHFVKIKMELDMRKVQNQKRLLDRF